MTEVMPLNHGKDSWTCFREMNDIFHEFLTDIFEEDRELVAVNNQTSSDLHDQYNGFQSF